MIFIDLPRNVDIADMFDVWKKNEIHNLMNYFNIKLGIMSLLCVLTF